jgi:hypothetical protein
MLHQRLLKNKVGKKFKKGQIWVSTIKTGTKGKSDKRHPNNRARKDLHRFAEESRNSQRQVHEHRQPQSLLSLLQVLGGWPMESTSPCFAEGEVKMPQQCGVLQKE